MRASMTLIRLAAGLASLALTACLISEEPLLDASNGRAKPFAAGAYTACQIEEDSEEPDCARTDITVDKTGLYRFHAEDDDETTLVRLRRLARGAFIAQLSSEDDESYYYFLAETMGAGFSLTLIFCEDIPKAIRDRYAARGDLDVSASASVCTAKSLRVVKAAAKAYRGPNAPESRSLIVYTPIVEDGE